MKTISIINIDNAAVRIAPYTRLTPAVNVGFTHKPVTDAQLWLKLENHQITGSFKVRGALNFVISQPQELMVLGLVLILLLLGLLVLVRWYLRRRKKAKQVLTR